MNAQPRPKWAGPDLSRRHLLRLGGGAAGLAALAACGDSGQMASGKTVTWQAIPPYSTQATTSAVVEYVNKQISSFEDSSGYTIEEEVSSSDITAAMAKLLQQANQGRAPDVGQVDSYIFPRFYSHAQPVDSSLQQAGLSADDWFPPFREIMTGGGPAKGMQFTTDVRVLYYRKDLVDTPPATWDEVIATGKKMKQQGKQFFFPAGRGEGAVNTTLWPMYWATGHKIIENGELGFASGQGRQEMLDCLAFVQRCIAEGITPKRVSTYGLEDDLAQEVVSGRAGMFLGGNWQVEVLSELSGQDFAKNWGVAPVPNQTGETFATSAGGWLWSFFAEKQAARDAAVKFIVDGWVGDEGMAGWCNVGGYLPPRESVFDHPAYKGNAFTPTFREHLSKYAQVRPPDKNYQDVSTALQVALSNVSSGQRGPEAALDEAIKKLS